jgi:hypothetical protein
MIMLQIVVKNRHNKLAKAGRVTFPSAGVPDDKGP